MKSEELSSPITENGSTFCKHNLKYAELYLRKEYVGQSDNPSFCHHLLCL